MKESLIRQRLESLSPEALDDITIGLWDDVMTDALYAAVGATSVTAMVEARLDAETMAKQLPRTLVKGHLYTPELLEHVGWTKGDGGGHEGYHATDYFSIHGAYLGPDCHGIEPLFVG